MAAKEGGCDYHGPGPCAVLEFQQGLDEDSKERKGIYRRKGIEKWVKTKKNGKKTIGEEGVGSTATLIKEFAERARKRLSDIKYKGHAEAAAVSEPADCESVPNEAHKKPGNVEGGRKSLEPIPNGKKVLRSPNVAMQARRQIYLPLRSEPSHKTTWKAYIVSTSLRSPNPGLPTPHFSQSRSHHPNLTAIYGASSISVFTMGLCDPILRLRIRLTHPAKSCGRGIRSGKVQRWAGRLKNRTAMSRSALSFCVGERSEAGCAILGSWGIACFMG